MKRYFITGASRGIGRAITEKLADPGHTLLLHGRDHEALAKTRTLVEAKSARAVQLYSDLRLAESVEKMIEEIGSEPIDTLVNNAEIASVKPLDQITLEEWQTIFAINVTAPFLLTQRLLPRMPGGSSTVNILSIAAKTGFPNWSAYCMSKFALEGFSQAVREEARALGVLNIYPAATDTEIWHPVEAEWPREKMLRPEEIGDAVAYALSRPADVAVENIALQDVTGSL